MLRGALHALGDDLASHSPNLVKVRIPKLDGGLDLEPSQTNQKTINNACFVFVSPSLLGSFNHIVRDDAAVWVGQEILLHFAGDNLLNLIFQPKSNLGNFL